MHRLLQYVHFHTYRCKYGNSTLRVDIVRVLSFQVHKETDTCILVFHLKFSFLCQAVMISLGVTLCLLLLSYFSCSVLSAMAASSLLQSMAI